MNKLPFVSIIVCTFNGGKRISTCLDSLINQDYLKSNYEIIVVNDGSTDNTLTVLNQYQVKIVNHFENLGIGAARNSGLQNASGEIIVYTDDDCIADTKWLENLIKHHKINVMAVGGIIISQNLDSLMEKYMSETGYGNPSPIDFAKSKNPLYRFFVYLKDMFSPLILSHTDPSLVGGIYTANASFKKEILKKAGGWATEFNSSEDLEMCDRLKKMFPSQKILFTKNAAIMHKHETSFWHLLKKTYYRSENTLRCYIKNNKIPPFFPFPIIQITISILAFFTQSVFGVVSLIVLPQLLYSWWLVKFMKNFHLYHLLFPYMQLGIELATITGMVRGFIYLKKKRNESIKI